MKTASEIKKGIECCYINQPKSCRGCPYSNDGINCGRNGAQIIEDVLEYIKTNEKSNQGREELITALEYELEVKTVALKDIIKVYLLSGKGDPNE